MAGQVLLLARRTSTLTVEVKVMLTLKRALAAGKRAAGGADVR